VMKNRGRGFEGRLLTPCDSFEGYGQSCFVRSFMIKPFSWSAKQIHLGLNVFLGKYEQDLLP